MASATISQNKPAKRVLPWLGRAFLGLVAVLVLLLVMGFVYETVASAADADNYPGQLVDVGGYRLHVYCVGEGSPTLVLEAGMSESSLTWAAIQPDLAEQTQTRVCAYDRAGAGWSDSAPSDSPRHVQNIVSDLHTLLTNADIIGPYVFVGHSLGGFVIRLYAAQYPDDVVGMVFVDSAHENVTEAVPEFASALQAQGSMQSTFAALARVGVTRVFGASLVSGMSPDFPQALVPHIPVMYSAKAFQTGNRELQALTDTWAQIRESRAVQPQWNVPMAVLYAAESVEMMPAWDDLQTDLTTLSTQSEIIFAAGSGHFIHYSEPALVLNAAQRIVNAARGN